MNNQQYNQQYNQQDRLFGINGRSAGIVRGSGDGDGAVEIQNRVWAELAPAVPTTDYSTMFASENDKEAGARSRREARTRDAVNARMYELWQTDGKYGVYNTPDLQKRAPFNDTLPINSRFIQRSYRVQPRYNEKGHRLAMNQYFGTYDPVYDSRNAMREIQAVVYEDKLDLAQHNAKQILTRAHMLYTGRR